MAFLNTISLVLLTTTAAATAQEKLPRVLILGDSTYRQPAADAAKALNEKAEVVFVPIQAGEVRNSTTALARLDEWLGEEKWDLIHFNFGLGDLVHRAPGMQSFRAFPKKAGGVRATRPGPYEKNLRQLVKRLAETGSKLIWASTTPIRNSSADLFEVGSEVEYNAIAARVMKENGVPINDLHTWVMANAKDKKDPSPFAYKGFPIHEPISRAIRNGLDLAD